MKNRYPHEKFSSAVGSMATSPKSLQDRVADAVVYDLIHLKSDDLPEAIRYRFTEVIRRLTSVEPTGSEGSVSATMNQMSTDEAIKVAVEILGMADAVESELYGR